MSSSFLQLIWRPFGFILLGTFPKRLNIEVKKSNREILELLFHDRLVTMKEVCRANMDKVPSDVEKKNIQFNITAKQKLIMCKTAKGRFQKRKEIIEIDKVVEAKSKLSTANSYDL